LNRIIPAQTNRVDLAEEPDPFPASYLEEVMISDDPPAGEYVRTESLPKQKKTNTQLSFRRLIMNSTVTKIAAAAIIIIGIGLGIHIFLNQGAAVTWADVFAKVEQVEGVIYRMKLSMYGIAPVPGGTLEQEIIVKLSTPYGMQMDSYMDGKLSAQTYALLTEEAMVSVLPEQKKYILIKFTPEIFEKMREENGDPTKMVSTFKEYEYEELGRRTIDGVEVEGILSTDPGFAEGMLGDVSARLWVDVETGWPFKMTIDVIGNDGELQMSMISDNFQWGAELHAGEFAANIPADYEEMGNVDLADLESGEAVVDGLGFFAELSGGTYPSELTTGTLVQELTDLLDAKKKEGTLPDEPDKEMVNSLMNLNLIGAFFGGLSGEDREPAYYGDKVTARDYDKVLFRWKLQDSDKYRVIYGDLSIEDVSPQRRACRFIFSKYHKCPMELGRFCGCR